MHLSDVILGQITTEKSEALKGVKTFTLRIAPQATKVDVKNALKKFYDVDAVSVRVLNAGPKTRLFGRGSRMQKRHRMNKALVTLKKDSKALDLTTFKN